MTSTANPRLVRRATRAAASVAGAGIVLSSVVLASPGHAEVPEGWSDPAPVDTMEAFLVIAGIPLALGLVLTLMTLLPAIARGETLGPMAAPAEEPERHWIGGPERGATELAAPDTEESKAGGASGRW